MGTEELQAIEEKLEKGEELTPEEQKIVEGPGVKDSEQEIDPEKETVIIKPAKDEKKKDDKAEKDSTTEDTPSEKDAETAEAKKKEAEDTASQIAERRKKIQEDVEKPLDQVDMKDYTPNETAMFYEMKGERRKRQDAQRETDTIKFQRAQEKAKADLERERAEAEAKAKEEEEHDPFEGLEEDDLLTAGQMKKILSQKKREVKATPDQGAQQADRLQKLQGKVWVMEAREKIPEALAICEVGEEVVDLLHDKIATAEVTEVVEKGGNPVIATVNYLKAHPKWPEIEAKIKEKIAKAAGNPEKAKDDEARTNKERADRIEANKKKPVTTGSGGGAPASGEYTIQELLDMPDEKFAQLPKAQRDKILESF